MVTARLVHAPHRLLDIPGVAFVHFPYSKALWGLYYGFLLGLAMVCRYELKDRPYWPQ